MVLPRFTRSQVRALFEQHTIATGQCFEEGVVELIFDQTQGQPWLCSRIGKEICFKDAANADRTKCIPVSSVDNAISIIAKKRESHMICLGHELAELEDNRNAVLSVYADEMNIRPVCRNDRNLRILNAYVVSGLLEYDKRSGIYRFSCPVYHIICTYLLFNWFIGKHPFTLPQNHISNDDIANFYDGEGKMVMKKIIQHFQEFWGQRFRANDIDNEIYCIVLMESVFTAIVNSRSRIVPEQSQALRPDLIWTRKLNGGQFYKVLIESNV